MSNLPNELLDEQSGVRPRSEIRSVGEWGREEEAYFRVAPLKEAEERLNEILQISGALGKLVHRRRQNLESERCAVCGSPFKIPAPNEDGGKLPYGVERVLEPGQPTLNLYSCSGACHAQLQWKIEHNRLELLMENERRDQLEREDMITRRKTKKG